MENLELKYLAYITFNYSCWICSSYPTIPFDLFMNLICDSTGITGQSLHKIKILATFAIAKFILGSEADGNRTQEINCSLLNLTAPVISFF